MPLRVTVDLIPGGNETKIKTLGVMHISRTSTIRDVGVKQFGDYVLKTSYYDILGCEGQVLSNIERNNNVFTFLFNILKGLNK